MPKQEVSQTKPKAVAKEPQKKKKRNPRRGERKTSPRRITAKEKQAQALQMRKAGLTYQVIADKLKYKDPSGAEKAVQAALRAIIQEPAEEYLQLELARLEAMLMALWPKVGAGNVHAVDRVLKIMERRAKYLGLDAPVKVDVEGDIDIHKQIDINIEVRNRLKDLPVEDLQKLAGANQN